MDIDDLSDWTFVIAFLFVGLLMAISMSILFCSSMGRYYKEKFAQKQNLSLPYSYEIGSMVMSRVISFFCIPFGAWLTLTPLVAIIDSDLSQDRLFALANTLTFFVSVPVIILTWMLGYQGAKLSILELQRKRIT